jgi:Tfp pilus assembly protein PilF
MRAVRVSRSRRAFRAVALAATALAAWGCAAKTTQIQRLQARAAYERGLADLRDARIALGMSGLKEAVALDPKTALYHDTLGLWLLTMKLPETREQAKAEFKKAIELEPMNADAHHNLGVALAEEARWEEAIAEYRTALATPTFATPDVGHHNLALALYNLGRYREAEGSLQLAIRLNPALPAAYYTLGLVLVKEGRAEEAKAAFRRTRDLDPNSPVGLAASQHLRALGDGG